MWPVRLSITPEDIPATFLRLEVLYVGTFPILPPTKLRVNMLRMKILWVAALVTVISYVQAQTIIGVKGGIGFPNLSDDSDNIYTQDFSSITTYSFGIQFDIPVASSFSFQPELQFSGKGGQRDGLQPLPPDRIPSILSSLLPAGLVPYANINNRSVLNYLEIPLLAKLSFGSELQFAIFAGPSLGFLTGAKQAVEGNSPLFLDPNGTTPLALPPSNTPLVLPFQADVNTTDDLKSFNFGLHAGLAVSYEYSTGNSFFLDGRLTYGTGAVQRDPQFGESKVGSVLLSLGFEQAM